MANTESNSPSKDKKAMEVDGEETVDEETQDTEDNAVLIEDQNKENQSNGTKSRKRKRNEDTNPDAEDDENAPRKKQKVSHDDQHDDGHDDPPKLEITINDETIQIEAAKLQNLRHFDGKILPIDDNEENGFICILYFFGRQPKHEFIIF